MSRLRRFVLLAAVAGATAFAAAPGAGASTPAEGWIYYVCGEQSNLCRVDPDGTAGLQLTTDGHAIGNPYGSPSVSRDGRRLVYRARIGPLRGYVRDLTTSAAPTLVAPSVGYGMGISPDGSRIAFEPDEATVCTASAVDGGGRRCVAGVVDDLAFADANRLIAAIRPHDPALKPYDPPNDELVEWPADGSAPPRTTIRLPGFGIKQPAVSPDGRLVAAVVAVTNAFEAGRIAIFDRASGKLLRYLTSSPSADLRTATDARPAWSPDGRRLVFQRGRQGEVNRLFVTAADGSPGGEQLLTAGGQPTWGPRPTAPDTTPATTSRLRAGASRLSVRVSEAASVRFTVDRSTTRRGGKQRPLVWTRVVRRTVAADRAGAVALRLGKRLRPGRYRLAVAVRDQAGNRSRTLRTTFRVR